MASIPKGRIAVDVPEGFAKMSEPVAEGERITDDEIVLSRADESDLLDIADGLHSCFPEVWWGKHEPLAIRAPYEVRRQRAAKRYAPWLRWPNHHPIKATLRSTGEFMGFAGWQFSDAALFNSLDGKLISAFRRPTWQDLPTGLGFQSMMGWSDEQVAELWEAMDIDSWEAEFNGYDTVRTEEMGAASHYYLAPLFVLEKFRGRGVGKKLLDYGAQLSEKHSPPLPCYLEALPNARPVYLHEGYEAQEGPGREAVMIRNPLK